MDQPIGRIRGLSACASEHGTFALLALDHRQNMRRALRPDDPGRVTYDEMVAFKKDVVRHVAGAGSGVLLDPELGAAQSVVDGSLPANVGLIVAIEATGYAGPATARVSRVLDGWSVAQAKRMGASAAKLLVYYNPDASNAVDQEQFVAGVAAECVVHDLALFVEPLSFPVDGPESELTGEARRRVVVETARRLTPLGGDVLKAEFPYDASVTDVSRWAEACAELDEATLVPWVLLSGGVDEATFERQVATACRAGASGVLAGRAIWAEAATLPGGEREAFLASTAWTRLHRLAGLVNELGSPWRTRVTPITSAPPPGEGWFRGYRANGPPGG